MIDLKEIEVLAEEIHKELWLENMKKEIKDSNMIPYEFLEEDRKKFYRTVAKTTSKALIKNLLNNEWIPVNDKLPCESENYLVTIENISSHLRSERILWFASKEDSYKGESGWKDLNVNYKVIAWKYTNPYML